MPPAARSFLSAREKTGEKRARFGVRACTAWGLGGGLAWWVQRLNNSHYRIALRAALQLELGLVVVTF